MKNLNLSRSHAARAIEKAGFWNPAGLTWAENAGFRTPFGESWFTMPATPFSARLARGGFGVILSRHDILTGIPVIREEVALGRGIYGRVRKAFESISRKIDSRVEDRLVRIKKMQHDRRAYRELRASPGPVGYEIFMRARAYADPRGLRLD